MILNVPVTSSDPKGWIRRAATAINALIGAVTSLDDRDTALEGRATALETFQSTATTELASLDARATDLETFAALPFTIASITLPPATLPASPAHGMLATDSADGKLKFYDGATWQPLY